MAFKGTSIEILALIFILIAGIKIIVVLINPKTWLDNVVKKVYKESKLKILIFLILSLIVLYFLLKELTIVQILAVMLFLSLLTAVGILPFSKEISNIADKVYKDKNLIKKTLLPFIIWIILLIWGLKELFL
ncbi:MAG: hypothetical protein AABW90_01800 [Nanoarchaeota archaeon]